MLSVIIITLNEAENIKECLASVHWADEIIVVDAESTDATCDFALAQGARVIKHPWEGFSSQRQFALEQARGDWVLSLDADERVSPELADEIKNLLRQPVDYAGFWIPFRIIFQNYSLRFGKSRREKHLRLFRRQLATYPAVPIHEGIKVSGKLGSLDNPIRHIPYRNITEYLDKCQRYTSLIAESKYKQGKRFHCWDHLRPFTIFSYRYFLLGGFMDGQAGFSYALLAGYYSWLKYLKLKELNREK